MKPLAKQQCVQVYRETNRTGMRQQEKSFIMELFHHEIVANGEHFPIANVFDISYYPKYNSNKTKINYRFLYLHTSSGIRTFYVKEQPEEFIQMYKKLVQGEL